MFPVDEKATDDTTNEEYNELVAALNHSLVTNVPQVEEEAQIDEFPNVNCSFLSHFKDYYTFLIQRQSENADQMEEAKKEAKSLKELHTLFKGLKFFISREVPREAVVFLIRCCEGQVSWDKTMFPGATFDESDETITHHIVDRPSVDKQYLSRCSFCHVIELQ